MRDKTVIITSLMFTAFLANLSTTLIVLRGNLSNKLEAFSWFSMTKSKADQIY